MKINFKSLKFQNWLYLMIFSLAILAVLWVLQFLFLDRFYESMKLNEIKKTGDKISGKFGDTDFHTIMNLYAFNNNLRIVMFDDSGQIHGALMDSHPIHPARCRLLSLDAFRRII